MKETLYDSDTIRTASGLNLDILNPKPEQISIYDIAHALANLCRFAGHTAKFYSVAQHCKLSTLLVSQENKLAALLHDATEAYLVDIPRPLKKHLADYVKIEHNLMKVIAQKFGFQYPLPPEVKKADELLLKIEWDNLMICREQCKSMKTALPSYIAAEDPCTAKYEFLKTFKILNEAHKRNTFTITNT